MRICNFSLVPSGQEKNIAMGYVPFEGTLNKHGLPVGNYGQKFSVQLPEQYAKDPGQPVDAEVVPMPFTASKNHNIREKINS